MHIFNGLRWNIKLILYIIIGAIAGFVILYLAGDVFVQENRLIWEERIEVLQVMEIRHAEIFQSLFMKRMIVLFLMFLIGFTRLGRSFMCIGSVWFGLSCSSLCCLFIQMEGIKGLLLFLTFLFPHVFIYFLIFVYFFYSSHIMTDLIGKNGVQRMQLFQWSRHTVLQYLVAFFAMLVLMVFGILLEVWCNPILLKKIATFF